MNARLAHPILLLTAALALATTLRRGRRSRCKPGGASTRKGGTLFLHVFDWPTDGKLVVGGLKANVKRAFVLADPTRAPLAAERVNDRDVLVHVPASAPDAVVAVETDGVLTTGPARLLSPAQTNTLRAFGGQLNGAALAFGDGKAPECLRHELDEVGGFCLLARASDRADDVRCHHRL